MRMRPPRRVRSLIVAAAAVVLVAVGAHEAGAATTQPWMNTAQTPEQRAAELLAAMAQAEKLTTLHGGASCGHVGCVDANTRLGIPALHLPASAA